VIFLFWFFRRRSRRGLIGCLLPFIRRPRPYSGLDPPLGGSDRCFSSPTPGWGSHFYCLPLVSSLLFAGPLLDRPPGSSPSKPETVIATENR